MKSNKYCLLLGSEMGRERSVLGAARATNDDIAIADLNSKFIKNRYADLYIEANPFDHQSLLKKIDLLHKKSGLMPSAVIPLVEMSLEPGYFVAEEYSLPYLSKDTIRNCRDKYLMKNQFRENLLPVSDYGIFGTIEELQSLIKTIGIPGVVKPRNSGGSSGVILVNDVKQVESIYEELISKEHAPESYMYTFNGKPFLYEMFIEASSEVSVEILHGMDSDFVLAVTDKELGELPYFVEMGHTLPSKWMSNKKLLDVAVQATKSLGINKGISHVELKIVNEHEFFIIEVNARPGGDSIMHLLEMATGINPLEFHCLSYIDPSFSVSDKMPLNFIGKAGILFMKAKERGFVTEIIYPGTGILEQIYAIDFLVKKGDPLTDCVDSHSRVASLKYLLDNQEKELEAELRFIAELLVDKCIKSSGVV